MSSNDLYLDDVLGLYSEAEKTVFSQSGIEGYSDFYKESEELKIWWIDKIDVRGEFLFSFDKKKIYNLFADYPHNMTKKEVEIFNKENPFWKDFFAFQFCEAKNLTECNIKK